MDLTYSEEYEAFRAEVRSFLAESWSPRGDGSRAEREAAFRARAIEAGYLARAIPRRYGGSEQTPDVLKATIIAEEFRRVRAPRDVAGLGPALLVPTLLECGEEWMKEKFVGPTIRGELIWCQGYSEPGAGSDLASLQTRAELVGDEWVINGQKIWTSGAQRADYMFCLCRTEPEATKHAGISYLLIDMKQPGVEVRPLKQITGDSNFSEVFLNDVRTPRDWIVGKRGQGWVVSRTTLKHERNMIAGAEETSRLFERLLQLAREVTRDGRPALEDPEVRQRLARLEGRVRAHEAASYYQLTCAAKGRPPGRIQTMNKLNGTNIGQEVAKLALDLLEEDGLLEPPLVTRRPDGTRPPAVWLWQYLGSLGAAIAGGTANIQRNIIAERALGLPRDAAAQRS